MNCTGCGKDLPQGAKFCLECGTKVAVKPVCTGCGKELPPEAKFCLECGTKCGAGAAPGNAPPAAEPKVAVPQNMVLVCGQCGEPAKEGKKFCLKCGANIAEAGVMKPAAEAAQPEAAAGAAAGAGAIAGADLPMKDMASDVNHWSYKIPAFFEDLDMAFTDEEGKTAMTSEELPYSIFLQQKEYGAEVKSFYDLTANSQKFSGYFCTVCGYNGSDLTAKLFCPQCKAPAPKDGFKLQALAVTVSAKNKTEINGLPALYYQAHDESAYFHCANVLFSEKAKIYFLLTIAVPKEDKAEFREMMDAFIYSFKPDGEKWNAKIAQWEKEAEELAVMQEEAISYIDGLSQKFELLYFADGFFSAKKDKEVFISALNCEKFAKGEYLIFNIPRSFLLLTNKAIHYTDAKNGFHAPWSSITKITGGANTIVEFHEGGNSVTKFIGHFVDLIVELLNQMWQDFGNPPAQSQAQPAPQPAAAQPKARACTACGKELKPAAKFCPICGASQ